MATKKQFIDINGLKTFWGKIKQKFVSMGGGYLEVSSNGDYASLDIKSSKIEFGTDSTKDKLVTTGYIDNLFDENKISKITDSEIDDLFLATFNVYSSYTVNNVSKYNISDYSTVKDSLQIHNCIRLKDYKLYELYFENLKAGNEELINNFLSGNASSDVVNMVADAILEDAPKDLQFQTYYDVMRSSEDTSGMTDDDIYSTLEDGLKMTRDDRSVYMISPYTGTSYTPQAGDELFCFVNFNTINTANERYDRQNYYLINNLYKLCLDALKIQTNSDALTQEKLSEINKIKHIYMFMEQPFLFGAIIPQIYDFSFGNSLFVGQGLLASGENYSLVKDIRYKAYIDAFGEGVTLNGKLTKGVATPYLYESGVLYVDDPLTLIVNGEGGMFWEKEGPFNIFTYGDWQDDAEDGTPYHYVTGVSQKTNITKFIGSDGNETELASFIGTKVKQN